MAHIELDLFYELIGNHIKSESKSCLIWPGAQNDKGYGCLHDAVRKITISPHRLSASLFLGLDLEDSNSFACHRQECVNKLCFNPDHLYIGTHKENQEDRAALITHCKQGHEFTESNTYIALNSKYPKRQCRRCKADREKIRQNRLRAIQV